MGIYEANTLSSALLCGEDIRPRTVVIPSIAVVIGAHLRSEQVLEEGGW